MIETDNLGTTKMHAMNFQLEVLEYLQELIKQMSCGEPHTDMTPCAQHMVCDICMEQQLYKRKHISFVCRKIWVCFKTELCFSHSYNVHFPLGINKVHLSIYIHIDIYMVLRPGLPGSLDSVLVAQMQYTAYQKCVPLLTPFLLKRLRKEEKMH